MIHRLLLGWLCFVSLLQKRKGLNEIAIKLEVVSRYMAYHNRRSEHDFFPLWW